MTDTYKTLYQGQLSTSAATLYTVPNSPTALGAIIKHVSVINTLTTGGSVTFQLFRNGTTAQYQWTPASWSLGPGEKAEFDGTLGLNTTEYIAGVAGAATAFSVIIDGDQTS